MLPLGHDHELPSEEALQSHAEDCKNQGEQQYRLALPEALSLESLPPPVSAGPMSQIPAYVAEGLHVTPAPITQDQHGSIGPWVCLMGHVCLGPFSFGLILEQVLQQIFGPPVAVPTSPRKRLSARNQSPRADSQAVGLDGYNYLRQLGDEGGREMGDLPELVRPVLMAVSSALPTQTPKTREQSLIAGPSSVRSFVTSETHHPTVVDTAHLGDSVHDGADLVDFGPASLLDAEF